LFIWLVLFGNIISLSSNVNSLRKYRKHRTSRKSHASKNKWVRLIEGLASGFTGVDEIGEKLMTCLSNLKEVITGDDNKPDPEAEKDIKPEEEPTSKIGVALTIGGWITKGICLAKGSIVDAVKKVLIGKRKSNKRFSKMLFRKK